MKSKTMFGIALFILLVIIPLNVIGTALYDYGYNAKNNGVIVTHGNLTLQIYSSATGGIQLYSNTFTNAIQNGKWNVSFAATLNYSQVYYKDYKINGQDINFSGADRIAFSVPYPSNKTLSVDETHSRVGIGTNNPSEKLTVIGNVLANIFYGTFQGTFNGNWNGSVNYYTKSQINTNLSNYYTKQQTNNNLSNYYTKSQANNNFTNYYTKSQDNTNLSKYYNKTLSDSRFLNNNGDSATGNYSFDSGTLFIDSTNHRVGIGTVNPQAKLEVNGLGTNYGINGTGDLYGVYGSSSLAYGYGVAGVSNNGIYGSGGTGVGGYFTSASGNALVTGTGNVGIGTTSPNYPLELSKSNSSGIGPELNLNNPAGTYGDESAISFSSIGKIRARIRNDLNGDAWGSGNILFETLNPTDNVVEQMRITSTGYLGVGTASPQSKLDVNGMISANGSDAISVYTNNPSGLARIWYTIGGRGAITDSSWNVGIRNDNYSTYNSGFSFESRATGEIWTSKLFLTQDGKIGIGTTNPLSKLEVTGSLVSQPLLNIYSTTGGNNQLVLSTNFLNGNNISINPFISGVNNGGFEIRNSTTNLFTISPSGNVGIGTTSPGATLHLTSGGNNAGAGGSIAFGANQNFPGPIAMIKGALIDAGSNGSSSLAEAGDLVFYTTKDLGGGSIGSLTERMRINSVGNIGIGTTSPTQKLDVNGNITQSINNPYLFHMANSLNIKTTGDSIDVLSVRGSTSYGSRIDVYAAGDSSVGTMIGGYGDSYFNAGNVGIGTTNPQQKLDVNGYIQQNGATNCALSSDSSGKIICTSDERLKNLHGNYSEGLNVIENINPIKFSYKNDSYIHIGFSAQNVNKVLPEATPIQANGYYGLDSNAITAALVNSVKEQQKIIKNQNNSIEELKDDNYELKKNNAEQKSEISLLKSELCNKDNSYSWCTK